MNSDGLTQVAASQGVQLKDFCWTTKKLTAKQKEALLALLEIADKWGIKDRVEIDPVDLTVNFTIDAPDDVIEGFCQEVEEKAGHLFD